MARFLIITQELALAQLLPDALTVAGHKPTRLRSSQEGLAWLEEALRRNTPPAAILLDESALRSLDAQDRPFRVSLAHLYRRWEQAPPPLILLIMPQTDSELHGLLSMLPPAQDQDLAYPGVRFLIRPLKCIPDLRKAIMEWGGSHQL